MPNINLPIFSQCMDVRSYYPVVDGGWGWVVLTGAFLCRAVYAGIVMNSGVYMVEWQESFSVGAGGVSVVATELISGAHAAGIVYKSMYLSVISLPVTVIPKVRYSEHL